MRMNFHVYGSDMFVSNPKFAIRVFAGGVNGLSGEPVRANMATILKRLNGIEPTQDYLYVRGGPEPAQQWLDGIAVAPGVVRQFVAVPHLSPESIESQVTGSGCVGGIQLEVIPQHQLGRFRLMRRDHHVLGIRSYGERAMKEYPFPAALETPSELGIPVNTRVHARERGGPSRERTLLDELDWASMHNRARRTVELQLWPPPCSKGSFIITVKCHGRRKPGRELQVPVFPETTVGFVKEQAAYALALPPELWTISKTEHELNTPATDSSTFFSNENSSLNESESLSEVNIQRGQILFLVPEMCVGSGTQSGYSPLLEVGAGARIRQRIIPDEEDPRSWDTNSARLINIQIINAEAYPHITGLQLPPFTHPVSFETYVERNLPFSPDSPGPTADLQSGLSHIRAYSKGPVLGDQSAGSASFPGCCGHCGINWASYR
jgi:hypothetical protein